MKNNLNIQEISALSSDALRNTYALHGLLDVLEEHHFSSTLNFARKEAGAPDDEKGSFWWMQNHYNTVSSIVLAANCLAEILKKDLDAIDSALPCVCDS